MQFSTSVAADLAGASERQLRYWNKTKLLRPTGKSTGHRRYTFPDLVALKTIKALRDQSTSLQAIRKAVSYLRRHFPATEDADVLSSMTLLGDGDKVYLRYDAEEIHQIITGQKVIWAVAVGRLIQDARARTADLVSEWTEPVTVRRRRYHLTVTRDPESGTYTVQCRELPGAIEEGDTPAEAIENGKAAIASVLEFQKRRRSLTQRRAAGG